MALGGRYALASLDCGCSLPIDGTYGGLPRLIPSETRGQERFTNIGRPLLELAHGFRQNDSETSRLSLPPLICKATLPIPFPARNGRPRKRVDAKMILALRAQGIS